MIKCFTECFTDRAIVNKKNPRKYLIYKGFKVLTERSGRDSNPRPHA